MSKKSWADTEQTRVSLHWAVGAVRQDGEVGPASPLRWDTGTQLTARVRATIQTSKGNQSVIRAGEMTLWSRHPRAPIESPENMAAYMLSSGLHRHAMACVHVLPPRKRNTKNSKNNYIL